MIDVPRVLSSHLNKVSWKPDKSAGARWVPTFLPITLNRHQQPCRSHPNPTLCCVAPLPREQARGAPPPSPLPADATPTRLGSALYGYDLGVIASVLVAPDFLRTTGLTGTDTTTQNYIGFITSSMLLGAFVGSIPAGLIADKFSRRIGITVAAVLFLVGGTIQTAAINKEMMMAGRFFAGMSIGGMCMLVPLYQSEISLPRFRGRLTTLQQFFLGGSNNTSCTQAC